MFRHPSSRRPVRYALTSGVAVAILAAAACAPSSGGDALVESKVVPSASVDPDFSLDALVAAAKKEGSLTVYDSTGDITAMAEAFGKKYGIKTVGVKSDTPATLEKMTREFQSGNVTIDLTLYEDGPTLVGKLLPQKIVRTWLPGDLVGDIDEADRTPPQVLSKANVWAYNPKLFPNGCPIKNVWDLTDAGWRGKITMQDPMGKPNIISWMNQLAESGKDELAAAYQEKNGKKLTTSEPSPAHEWIKRLAANDPILTSSDDDAAQAVGSPKQTQPRIGLMSVAKFRDVKTGGLSMRVCEGMRPWVGYQYPKYAAIAAKSAHPNAAQLFVHYAYTKEGISHEWQNGGISANAKVGQAPYSPPGLTDWDAQLFSFDAKRLTGNFAQTRPMQDFWQANHG